jgi:hypothetical protein
MLMAAARTDKPNNLDTVVMLSSLE